MSVGAIALGLGGAALFGGGYWFGRRSKITDSQRFRAGVRKGERQQKAKSDEEIWQLSGQVQAYEAAAKAAADAELIVELAIRYGSTRVVDGRWTGCWGSFGAGSGVYAVALDEGDNFKTRPFLTALGWEVVDSQSVAFSDELTAFARQVKAADLRLVFVRAAREGAIAFC